MGTRLARAAAELRLGADPVDTWTRLGEHPGLAPLARCLARACESGAPPAAVLARLADAQRAAAARAAQARVRRAGVLATAPLGLCFLPAFVLTGVVPTVVGLAAHFLTGL
jgi:pilus assembly protein TadC